MRKRVQDSYLVKCFLVVFLCFVVDSTIHYFLPYNFTKTGITITPYLGLMMFALLVRTIDGAERYFFATICGLYYSVVYANSLAIYILIYCLIAFVRSYLFKLDTLNIIESIIILYFDNIRLQVNVIVYWLMWITNMTRYPMVSFCCDAIVTNVIV